MAEQREQIRTQWKERMPAEWLQRRAEMFAKGSHAYFRGLIEKQRKMRDPRA